MLISKINYCKLNCKLYFLKIYYEPFHKAQFSHAVLLIYFVWTVLLDM